MIFVIDTVVTERTEVIEVKKRLAVFLFISLMAFSFAIPAMATEATVPQQVSEVEAQEIVPLTEMTRLYWRTYHGVLQMRVWSITNGRWLTDWIPL